MADTQNLTVGDPPAGEQVGEAQPDTPSMAWSIPKPFISKALYQKAYTSNDQLTKLERLLIFTRCDVPGKALARPTTITEAERNQILGRPPPDLLAKTIRAMTKNAMSTIPELVTDQGHSLDWLGSLTVRNSFWSRETRSLQGIRPPWWYSAANNAAARLHELPGERALHHEVGRRLRDPETEAELLAKTGKMDPVSGKLMLTRNKASSNPELESAQQERVTSFARQRDSMRTEIGVQVLAELEALSEVEGQEMRELIKRERVEYEKEVAYDAREAERKAAERKREIDAAEEEEKEEVRSRRRRKRAAFKAKYGDADYTDSDSDGSDREEGEFPTSEDTW